MALPHCTACLIVIPAKTRGPVAPAVQVTYIVCLHRQENVVNPFATAVCLINSMTPCQLINRMLQSQVFFCLGGGYVY